MTTTTTTTIHLLRHGEVDNPDQVLYGRLPGFRLSADGLAMAKLAADALRDYDITYVATSPLERAVQTADAVAAATGVQPVVDDRLMESANVFEGRRLDLSDPRSWWAIRDPWRPSWGEAYVDVAARVQRACDAARVIAAGAHAVLVSHQLPIWVTRRAIEGRRLWHRPDRRQCALASLTSLHYDGERVVSITYTEPAGALGRRHGPPGA
jgi:broad specificity phosphatase PhoE